MDYIKGATDYLGLTTAEPVGTPLSEAATGAPSAAISATELVAKKELNQEILSHGDVQKATTPTHPLKNQLNQEILSTETNTLLHPAANALPDTSAKSGLNHELLHTQTNQLLHPSSTALPNTSAKRELNSELVHTDPGQLLNHVESTELRAKETAYQPIALETQKGIDLDSPSISSRPEFQRPPFVEREAPHVQPASEVLPPQMSQHSSSVPQTAYNQHSQTATQTRAEPTNVQTIQKDVVVHERIHPVQKEEIQPVIYREREQLDVKQVTQMLHETQVQPTIIERRELPAEHRADIIERGAAIPENYVQSTRQIDATRTEQIVHAPIIEETLKKTIVQEVQPVLERDVIVPTVVHTQVPVYEKIVEAPTVIRETREIGTRDANFTGQNLLNSQNFVQTQSTVYQSGSVLPPQQRGLNTSDNYSVQNMMTDQSFSSLPTGQVLPNIASSRPAYAHLPPNYQEKRPDFIGTSSQYVAAANNITAPLDVQKNLYNPYVNSQGQPINNANIPHAFPRQ